MRQATLSWTQPGARCSDEAESSRAKPAPTEDALPVFDPPSEAARPLRTARSKRPLSYREDLKAVLKADAADEAALLSDSSAPKRTGKAKARPSDDDDGFHIVSHSKPPPPAPEPKPLSLAVKGFGTANDGPAHPFFTKKVKPPPPPPIPVRDDSPEPRNPPAAPVFKSLFSALKRPPADRPKLKPSVAPWPSAYDTHVVPVEGIVDELKADLPAFRTQWARQAAPTSFTPSDPPCDFIQRMNTTRPSTPTSSINVATASPAEEDTAQRKAARHQLWTDVWRPHAAQQCLGNEPRAVYLADWLRRLLVAAPGSIVDNSDGQKRKKAAVVIQRRVDKKRRRRAESDSEDEMADFIVSDDEIEDEDERCFDKFRRIGSDDESEGEVEAAPGGPLTNCMVLCGASGSGKTAAVYACASELGFEVFELYPGMGRRAGKDMLGAVGDLGRNHMVSSGGSGGGATWKQPRAAPPTTARQSLILIEEADVLFEDDKGFWAAVVELVAESKRPVVITCNDLDLVPTHDLPVQQVLRFEPPALPTAVPYLSSIAAATPDAVQKLLEQPRKDEDGAVDLRQAIAQLQFGTYVNPCVRTEQQLDLVRCADTRALARAADVVSCADLLAPKPELEAHGDSGVEQQAAVRQLGTAWRQLVPSPLASRALSSASSAEFSSALLEFVPVQPAAHTQLAHKQAQHMAAVHTTLKFVRTAHTSAPGLLLDYAPLVRIMGAVDDDLHQIHESLRANGTAGRSTRNSVRSFLGLDDTGYGYVRWLPFGPHETRAVRQSALVWE